jgi:hypothetical protein
MSDSEKRDWTQADIIAATEERLSGPGFFDELSKICDAAFGGALDYGAGQWNFPMGTLSVGEVLDFFSEHRRNPMIEWINDSGPVAFIVIDDFMMAAAFEKEFDIPPLTPLAWHRLTELANWLRTTREP